MEIRSNVSDSMKRSNLTFAIVGGSAGAVAGAVIGCGIGYPAFQAIRLVGMIIFGGVEYCLYGNTMATQRLLGTFLSPCLITTVVMGALVGVALGTYLAMNFFIGENTMPVRQIEKIS